MPKKIVYVVCERVSVNMNISLAVYIIIHLNALHFRFGDTQINNFNLHSNELTKKKKIIRWAVGLLVSNQLIIDTKVAYKYIEI